MANYKIDKKVLKNDVVNVTFISDKKDKIKVTMSLDDYYDNCYKENVSLSLKDISILKKKEPMLLAYRSALRRLAQRDYSVKKMKDSLKLKYDISNNDLNTLINNLIDKGYLNDDKYTMSKVAYLDAKGLSMRSITNKLKNDGISDELISKYNKVTNSNELVKAKSKGIKYNNSVKGKSLNAKKQTILTKLCNDGFSLDTSKEVLKGLDFNEDVKLENNILEKEFNKIYTKYSKRYDGYELKNKLYTSLLAKGFNHDLINEILDRMEK